METAFVSPLLFDDGRPVLTVKTVSSHYLDDFSGACVTQYRFFKGNLEVTAEVAQASQLPLHPSGTLSARDHDDLVMTYADKQLGDATGFDVMLVSSLERQDTIVRTPLVAH